MTKWVQLAIAVAGGAAISCTAVPQAQKDEAPAKVPAPARDANPESPITPSLVQNRGNTNITRLYIDTCAKCHGANGEGGGAGTKTLLTREKFDQKLDRPFFDATKNGVPEAGMEAYGPTLSNEEIWGLVVHIRELQARALRQAEGGPKEVNGVYTSKKGTKYRVETFLDNGMRLPWSMDWLPDGRMLVTNRSGFMVVVEKDGRLGPRVADLPPSVEMGQGGLMEVAVHPDYAKNGWVYLSLSDPSDRGAQTKIVRGKLAWNAGQPRWVGTQTIFQADPSTYTRVGVHFGSKIVFDGKGKLYFSIGERGGMEAALDVKSPVGKIFRINDDGTVPRDNPFVNVPGAVGAIWSTGHRNPQGLTLGLDGSLWDTEHGPRGGDELNLITKGASYGWSQVAFSINYNDSPFRIPWNTGDMKHTLPVYRWLPSIGASGLDTVRGAAFPGWRGDLVAGGLSGANLDRFRVQNGKLIEHEELVWGMGRVRDVAVSPEGYIHLALNQPDKIVRLVPVR